MNGLHLHRRRKQIRLLGMLLWLLSGLVELRSEDVTSATLTGSGGPGSSFPISVYPPKTEPTLDDGTLCVRSYPWFGSPAGQGTVNVPVKVRINNQNQSAYQQGQAVRYIVSVIPVSSYGKGQTGHDFAPLANPTPPGTSPPGRQSNLTVVSYGETYTLHINFWSRVFIDLDGNGCGYAAPGTADGGATFKVLLHSTWNGPWPGARYFKLQHAGVITDIMNSGTRGTWNPPSGIEIEFVDDGSGSGGCQFFYDFQLLAMPAGGDTIELVQQDGETEAVVKSIPIAGGNSSVTGSALVECNQPVTPRLASGARLFVSAGPAIFSTPEDGIEWNATFVSGEVITYDFELRGMPPQAGSLEMVQELGGVARVVKAIPLSGGSSVETGSVAVAPGIPIDLRFSSGLAVNLLEGSARFTAPADGTHWAAILAGGEPKAPLETAAEPSLEGRIEPPDQGQTGCGSCATAACVIAQAGCLDLSIGLGNGLYGESAGFLRLWSELPSDDIYKTTSLSWPAADGYAMAPNVAGTAPAQFVAPAVLVNVVAADPLASPYNLEFYHRDPAAAPDPDGTYPVSGDPFATVTVENPDAGGMTNRGLRVTRIFSGTTEICEFDYDDVAGEWSTITENGTRVERLQRVDAGDTNGNSYDETLEIHTMANGSGTVLSKTRARFEEFPFGIRAIELVNDPDPGGRQLTRRWEYDHSVPVGNPEYGRLRLEVQPSGAWTRFEYTQLGDEVLVSKRISQFLDADEASATENASRVEERIFNPSGAPTPSELTVERLLGQEVARRYRIERTGGFDDIVCQTPGAAWNDPENFITQTRYYTSGEFAGEIASVKNPDGTVALYSYSAGPAGDKTATIKSGVANAAGDDIVDGTQTVSVTSREGFTMSSLTTAIPGGEVLEQSMVTAIDSFGRPTAIAFPLDGTTETTIYGCCDVIDARTDRRGITTSFTDIDDVRTETRLGITLTTQQNGRVTTVTRTGTDSSDIALSETEVNIAGETIRTRDARGQDTFYSETVDEVSGHIVRTAMFPDEGTRVETFYPDGNLFTLGGSAGYPRKYVYGVDADGTFVKEIFLDVGGGESEWVKTITDAVGRAFRVVRPLPGGGSAVSESFYNGAGQLERTTDPDDVSTLYAYDARGRRDTVAIDMDAAGAIDYDGADRIARTEVEITTRAGGRQVERITQKVWDVDGDDASSATLSVTDRALDGLDTWVDVGGLITATNVSYAGNGAWTETVTFPDDSMRTRVFTGGRQVSDALRDAVGAQVVASAYSYDAHGRLQSVTDARNGATNYTYHDDDQIHTITSPSPGGGAAPQVTEFVYDNMGRRDLVRPPDHTAGDPVEVDYDYYPAGNLERVSGARTYAVNYGYDAQGRLATLVTAGGTAVWDYEPESGRLERKTFADSTDVDYTYTAAGRVQTRKTQRGIVTTYGYNAAGELNGVDYSDATPDVTYFYNRLGQVEVVTRDGATYSLTYDAFGRLLGEAVGGGILDGVTIEPGYDALQRRKRLTTLVHGAGILQEFGYDFTSRLKTVSQAGCEVMYAYEPDSALVSGIEFRSGGATPIGALSKTHDFLNRLESIAAVSAGVNGVNQSFVYAYNDANQRTRVDQADETFWAFGFDGLGHLDSAEKHRSELEIIDGRRFEYVYDAIGNRTESITGFQPDARTTSYTPKTGDPTQYDTITAPGFLAVSGRADPAAAVTVNGEVAARQGDYFSHEIAVDNSGGAVAQAVQIEATLGGDTDVIQRTEVIPPATVAWQYDADGNLVDDGYRVFTWDGENRLLSVETKLGAAPSQEQEYRVLFDYDYLGRRIQKRVYGKPAGAGGAWVIARGRKYLYDGWNCVAEFEGKRKVVMSYLWGLDLDGQSGGPPFGQGAGGVGGLLGIRKHRGPDAGAHFVTYDGNGNVTGLVDAATGAASAAYEYDPFGNELQATGPAARLNPFRFSTKYSDEEAGLVYYGFRYYEPVTGRWLNRDPVGEAGGENLYGFVANDPGNTIDPLGLALYAFDGTGNTYEQQTHVGILTAGYLERAEYEPGVGTDFFGLLDNRPVGGVTGTGGTSRLESMYRKFQVNWTNGDRMVDIIGFSRGAALARAFAQLLDRIGYVPPDRSGRIMSLRELSKCASRQTVNTRFVGLFDTVASFGIPGNSVNLGYSLDIPRNVSHVAHAIAADEKRALFTLTFLNEPSVGQTFSEFVFPGDHSDIGGAHGRWVTESFWVGAIKDTQRQFVHDLNRISLAPLLYIWSEGVKAGVPFGAIPQRSYNNSSEPHDLSTNPTMILGAKLFGSPWDGAFPVQPRRLPLGRLK